MTIEEMCKTIEHKIAEIQNENYSDPRIQQLLDFESDIVLREYYDSIEYSIAQRISEGT